MDIHNIQLLSPIEKIAHAVEYHQQSGKIRKSNYIHLLWYHLAVPIYVPQQGAKGSICWRKFHLYILPTTNAERQFYKCCKRKYHKKNQFLSLSKYKSMHIRLLCDLRRDPWKSIRQWAISSTCWQKVVGMLLLESTTRIFSTSLSFYAQLSLLGKLNNFIFLFVAIIVWYYYLRDILCIIWLYYYPVLWPYRDHVRKTSGSFKNLVWNWKSKAFFHLIDSLETSCLSVFNLI